MTETQVPSIEQIQANMANVAPEDMAAKEFQMGMPAFKRFSKEISRKELVRVINALISYPLEDVPKFQSGIGEDLFKLGTHLMTCKLIMMQAVYKEKSLQEQTKTEGEENVSKS